MLEENKFLIFDNPIKTWKYIIKRCMYTIKSPIYKLRLDMHHPRYVDKKKYYSSICAIFKNEARYLKEWIEYHRIIGIEHFYLYNNFSEDDYISVLQPYIDISLVTLIQWPVKQGQMGAYSDCAKKFGDETNWIAYIDLDEYIVPNTKDNINDLLKPFEHNRPILIAYWRLFGTSGLISRDTKGLVTEDFSLCWRKYTNIGKVFFNTAYDYAENLKYNTNMHSRWSNYKNRILPPVNFYDNAICCGIDKVKDNYPPVQINHYFTKSYNEYLEKMARGDAFFELNPRDEDYFNWHDMKCQSSDYNIRKYMIKLKKAMESV